MRRLFPASIHPPFAAYAPGVEVPPGARLVFVSGQLGIAADGTVPEDCTAQAELCFGNIDAILAEAGMTLRDVVRLNAYVTARDHLKPYMAVRDRRCPDPVPASTLMIVAGFARPEFVLEVEAIAASSQP